MTGAQDYRVKPGKEAEILPADQRDAHIPWGVDLYSRKDLRAVASLMAALGSDCEAHAWDFESFPGALWDKAQQVLIVPVPVWVDLEKVSSVRLKHLVEWSHWFDKSRIRRLFLLPLQPEVDALHDAEVEARLARWREVMASLFGQVHLAVPDAISTVELGDLATTKRGSV